MGNEAMSREQRVKCSMPSIHLTYEKGAINICLGLRGLYMPRRKGGRY